MAGPIIGVLGTTASGILRPAYCRALAAALGHHETYTTDAVADGTEALRQIVCSRLVDDEMGQDALAGRYAYVHSGDQSGHQARLISTGYHGPLGITEISRPLTAALASGTEVDITSPLPHETHLGVKGLHQIVVDGLAVTTIEYRVSFSGNATESYSLLADEDYIDQDTRVDSIWDTYNGATASAPYGRSPFPARIEVSGGTRTLILGRTYSASETFQARILRQGHNLVRSNGAWGLSTTGPIADDQAAAVPVSWFLPFGMVKALQVIADLIERDETISEPTRLRRLTTNARDRQKWAAAAVEIAENAFPRPSDVVVSSMLWTPRVRGGLDNLQGGTDLPVSSLP